MEMDVKGRTTHQRSSRGPRCHLRPTLRLAKRAVSARKAEN